YNLVHCLGFKQIQPLKFRCPVHYLIQFFGFKFDNLIIINNAWIFFGKTGPRGSDELFESFTPSIFNLSSFSSSIITPAMTSGPITGPLPASSTPQTLTTPTFLAP